MIDDKDAIEKLKNTDKKAKESKDSFDKLVETGASIGAAVVAGTGAAIGGLMAMADSAAGNADKWDKLALRTGIGVENLQRWGYAAGQSGADITVLETGIKKLSDQMVAAQNGSEAAQDAYAALGISMKDLNNMTPEQAFERVMMGLAGMEDGALKNSIGNDLLGKSYVELKPLIQAGADGITDLKNRADELGLVMSGEAVSAGVVFGDTMADAKNSLSMAKDQIAIGLMPMLTDMLNWFISKMPEIKSATEPVFNGIADAIKWVADNSNWLIPVLGGVAGAFVALQIINVVNGLMTAYTTFTQGATFAQALLNAVMAANPIMLVVLAVAALIAIGVALIMNWDKVKAWFIGFFATMKEIFGKVGDVISQPFIVAGKVIENIMNTLVEVVKKPINWIIDGINKFIGGVNKIKIPDWVPEVGGKGFSLPTIPRLKVGLDYVPYDEFPAFLHKGERVLTAEENSEYGNNTDSSENQQILHIYIDGVLNTTVKNSKRKNMRSGRVIAPVGG